MQLANENELITFATRNCCAYAHPEIVIRCDPLVSPEAPHVISWIENMVAAGRSFRAGKTVQIGCSVCAIRHADEGRMMLHEPDFHGMPLVFVPSVTWTLMAIRTQKNVLDSFGLDQQHGRFPSIWDNVLRCKDFNAANGLMMCRNPEAAEAGWFLGCLDESHDHSAPANLVRESLYAVICRHPQITDFLSMPEGSMIVLDDTGQLLSALDANDQELQVRPQSYLDQKARLQSQALPVA